MAAFCKLFTDIMRRRDITPADKLVYTAIRDRIGKNRWAWPSIRTIADDCGIYPSVCQQAIDELELRGLLVVEHRGRGKVRRYSLPPESLPESGKLTDGSSLPESGNEFTGIRYGSLPESGNEPEQTKNQTKNNTILTYPVKGKFKQWNLTQDNVDQYAETYPSLDIMSECRKALQWCRDNPTKQKTAKGMTRFLNSWMGRAVDKATTTKPRDPLTDFFNS